MHIINALGAGGAERFMVDIVTRLDRRTFEIRVVCLFGAGTLAPDLAQAGIPVKTLGIRRVRSLNSWMRVWHSQDHNQILWVEAHGIEPSEKGLLEGICASYEMVQTE